MPRTTTARRSAKPKGMRRPYKKVARRQVARKRFNQPEHASLTEILQFPECTTNTMYGNITIALDQLPRASTIARGYAEFRMTGLTWKFKPRFDTFAATDVGANEIKVPYLYYLIDRNHTYDPVTMTLGTMKAAGAIPRRFDDKTLTAKYKPAVLVGNQSDESAPFAVFTEKKISPYLSTNSRAGGSPWLPNSTEHYGIWWFLESGTLPGDGAYEYDVELIVDLEFRKPYWEDVTPVDQRKPAVRLELPKAPLLMAPVTTNVSV